jgi:hypothetical protein
MDSQIASPTHGSALARIMNSLFASRFAWVATAFIWE